jgi:hypothetical protein
MVTWLPTRPASGRRRAQTRSRACGPCGTDPLDRGLDIGGEGGDQSRHRRVRGHRPEQLRLCADHRDIGCTVAVERDRGPEVEEHLARVMSRPIRAPRPKALDSSRSTPETRTVRCTRSPPEELTSSSRVESRPTTSKPDTLHLRSAFRSETLRRRDPKSPVPDSVNEAAAFAQADLGLAMGSGTDVAGEASDLILVRGDLRGAAGAIRLSRHTLSTIKATCAGRSATTWPRCRWRRLGS